MMIIDPKQEERIYYILTGIVAPRPIAFISTKSSKGVHNLAPFSFFNAVSANPPTIVVGIGRYIDSKPKDTLLNIEETGEFVVNIVSNEIVEAMNMTAAEFPNDVDEFEIAGLTKAPSIHIDPPRVAESPVQLECKLKQVIQIGEGSTESGLVIAEILLIHLKDDIIVNNRIDNSKLNPVGRLSGGMYAYTNETLYLKRPIYP
ncbi:MAG: flavin reductase family protein [Dehalococcoidia bacterium]|nr:flavin reductase family protein [Dehalococcoidia bacterium]